MNNKAISYIRYSTKEQATGRSLKRQVEQAQKYCKENDLILDESIKYYDLGVSSFRGKNATTGMLSSILKGIETGTIEKGTTLIIEAIDRLTRAPMTQALEILLSIIKGGIRLKILNSSLPVIDQELIDSQAIYVGWLTQELQRAHEESRRKSELISDARRDKRELAVKGEAVISRYGVAWAKAVKEDGIEKFIAIPQRAKVVKYIFDLYGGDKGLGTDAIAQKLTEEKIEPWGARRGKHRGKEPKWNATYIKKILSNPAVIGHYQPMTKDHDTGKRIPVEGYEVITNYYPNVLATDTDDGLTLWNAVQNRLRGNKINARGGQNGKITNLFGNLFDCSHCDSTLVLKDKGNGTTLKCPKCNYYLKYGNFNNTHYLEFLLLKFLREIDISIVLGNENKEQELNEVHKKIESTKHLIAENQRAQRNTREAVVFFEDNESDDNKTAFLQQLMKLSSDSKELEQKLNQYEQQAKEIESNAFKEGLDKISALSEIIHSDADNPIEEKKKIEIRLKLRNLIFRIVERIVATPPTIEKRVGVLVIHYSNGNKSKITIPTKVVSSIDWQQKYNDVPYPEYYKEEHRKMRKRKKERRKRIKGVAYCKFNEGCSIVETCSDKCEHLESKIYGRILL